jgi:hypothetical protein
MKFNQWTLGLAAVGAVSLASAVRADEAKMSPLQTALSNTTISGYVDVAAQYNLGNAPQRSGYNFYRSNIDKRDAFSLNNVTISLDKPLDETPWAAGYHVDLNAGTDAINGFNTSYAYAAAKGTPMVRQAYIALRTPVGNGIDWKVGIIDGITGYEGNTAYANPNYSRSFGWAINPASYNGILGTYKVSDLISVTGGFINRGTAQGYGQSNYNVSSHDYVSSVSLTAPNSWGFLKGSALNLQTVQGFDNQAVNNYSVNGTLNTPVAGLTLGFAFDALQSLAYSADGNIYGLYATYQATDKLSFALRGEYVDTTDLDLGASVALEGNSGENQFNRSFGKGEELTGTITYNLWANVVSRAEIRWDHVEHGTTFYAANNGENENQITVALNLVYKF